MLPALIRKFHEATASGRRRSDVWGTGTPGASSCMSTIWPTPCVFLMLNYDQPEIVNVGTGTDVTIRELAEMIQRVTGFEGRLVFDASKPDGTPRKLLDVSKLTGLGWTASIPLDHGIAETYDWYRSSQPVLS